jgi:hypothetical protein
MKKHPPRSLPDLPDDDLKQDAVVRRQLDDLSASMALLPQRRRETAPSNPGMPNDAASTSVAPRRGRQDSSHNRGMPGTVSVSVMLPAHTNRDLTIRAAEMGVTKRFLIVEALRRGGYDVHPEDLTEDGRRK